jgi:hypothetical protein
MIGGRGDWVVERALFLPTMSSNPFVIFFFSGKTFRCEHNSRSSCVSL